MTMCWEQSPHAASVVSAARGSDLTLGTCFYLKRQCRIGLQK